MKTLSRSKDWSDMLRIESEHNPKIKQAKSLLTKKGRDKESRFLVEGFRNLSLALEFGYPIEQIFLREDQLEEIQSKGLLQGDEHQVYLVPDKIFPKICDTVTSQGIVAVCPIVKNKFESESIDPVLILDRVSDPGNAGTLIRTADSVGIRDIFYTPGTVDFYSPKVVRSAMGSLFYMNFYELEDIRQLKKAGYRILAATVTDATQYTAIKADKKTALILGNEAHGIRTELLETADEKVSIPIYGKAESLNVAVAGAVLMYKLRELIENKPERSV